MQEYLGRESSGFSKYWWPLAKWQKLTRKKKIFLTLYFQFQFFYYKTLKKHFKMFTKTIIKLLKMTKMNDFEWFCLYSGMDINGRASILEGKNLLYFYQTTVLHYIWHTYKSQNIIGKYGKSL